MGLFRWTPEDVAALRARAEKAEAEIARRNADDDEYTGELANTQARLNQAEHLLEAAKLARTPEGMTALADKVAFEVDDIYARGGCGVIDRRRYVAARVERRADDRRARRRQRVHLIRRPAAPGIS